MRINLNDRVRLRLTDDGRRTQSEYYAKFGMAVIGSEAPNADGWCEMQWWTMMQIFGPHTYLGGPQLIHENVVIWLGGA